MISEVVNTDCIEYMAQFPDNFFELAIVDPPYFSGPEKRAFYGKGVSTIGVKKIEYTPLYNSWDTPRELYFNELLRVSQRQIIWGINYYKTVLPASGRIVWDKVNDASSFSDCEIAYCSMINTVRIFRYMWSGMLQGCGDGTSKKMQGNKQLNEKKIHPTQKPVALYKWILKNYAKDGYKILDTHLGSGSSRIAAFDMGFEFYGCELCKKYFNSSQARFEEHTAQQRLFIGNEIQVKQVKIF